jgi:microcin C transport system permease protein
LTLSPLTRRRLANFPRQPARLLSLWIFAAAADQPRRQFRQRPALYVQFIRRPLVLPVFTDYPGRVRRFFATETITPTQVQRLIQEKGGWSGRRFRYSYDTIAHDLPTPAPSPPTWQN